MTANTTYYAQWNCDVDGYAEPACIYDGQYYNASDPNPACALLDSVVCVCIGKAQTWSKCDVGNPSPQTAWSAPAYFQW